MAAARLGQRCVTKDGWYGTVRYVGAVPPTEGEWVGVEWDDPSRGKHSGMHEGVQYFVCKSPKCGSFVREKSLNFGKDFVTALKERYHGNSLELAGGEDNEELTIQSKVVEVVGLKKIVERQSHLDRLKEVSLRDTDLSCAGEDGLILKAAPNIENLNLSTNPLLPSWNEVAKMARQLPRLVLLNLRETVREICGIGGTGCHPPTENVQLVFPKAPVVPPQDSIPTPNPVPTPEAFMCLKLLYMAKMQLKWEQVSAALPSLPALEELHVCKNSIDELGHIDAAVLASVKVLNFEDNCLTKWSEIRKLAILPSLTTLILSGNGLDHTDFSGLNAGQAGKVCFSSLQSLSLSRNNFVGWAALNDISSLPSLLELRFLSNPVLDGETPFNARQLVIARIGHLQTLNGSPITANERLLAERYYLKRYASRWAGSRGKEGPEKTFAAEHPCYNHLVAVHGAPEEALMRVCKASALKDQLVAVTIMCPEDPSGKEINKKLPGNMTVQKLRGLVQRFFKVDSFEQTISYFSRKASREFELDDDLRTLSFYAIQSGDTVIVRRK